MNSLDTHDGDSLSRLTNILDIYCEDTVIQCQRLCERELSRVLDELCVLVAVSDMSQARREYFVYGIAHLRGHIECESRDLQAERNGRVN